MKSIVISGSTIGHHLRVAAETYKKSEDEIRAIAKRAQDEERHNMHDTYARLADQFQTQQAQCIAAADLLENFARISPHVASDGFIIHEVE